jgi:hypothetical protein
MLYLQVMGTGTHRSCMRNCILVHSLSYIWYTARWGCSSLYGSWSELHFERCFPKYASIDWEIRKESAVPGCCWSHRFLRSSHRTVLVLNLDSPCLNDTLSRVIIAVLVTVTVVSTSYGGVRVLRAVSFHQCLHAPLFFSVKACVVVTPWPRTATSKIAGQCACPRTCAYS